MAGLTLSPRLSAIAAQVPQGARLTDVGTDHAYLPTALLLAGRIHQAEATDVNERPLRRGRETATLYGVSERINFQLRDGLDGIRGPETDTVVIAGMGGDLIARILERAPWTREKLLLLQPMTAQAELRQWLTGHGYAIQGETLVREGEKFYQILRVQGGEARPYTQGELWAGRQRQGEESPHRLDFLTQLIQRRRHALAGMASSAKTLPEELQQMEALVEELEDMREEWSRWQR